MPDAPTSGRDAVPLPVHTTSRSTVDRKSTRLNSSHVEISYAVFCLKKKIIDALRLAFMVRWTLKDTLAFLLLLSLLLPSLLIMFIPSTFKRPVSSCKALNLRKTLLMASSVRLKPLNCSRLPCVYAQETLTFLLTQKKTCVKNYVQKE